MSGYITRLGKETVVYGIAGTIGRVIGIFLVPLYTRVFSPAEYGIVAMLTAMVGLLSTFSMLGLDSASARWYYDAVSEDDDRPRKTVIATWFWGQLAASFVVTAATVAFAVPLAQKILESSSYAGVFVLAMLAIPLATIGKVLVNWFRYQRRAWATMIFTVISSLLLIVVTVLFVAVWRMGLSGLYYAQLVAGAGTVLVAMFFLRGWIDPRFVSGTILSEMTIFGLPLVPAAVASWVTASADRFFLRSFRTTTEIGVYAIAGTLASGVALVTNAFQMAWGPFAFSIWREENAGRVYSKVFSLYMVGGCLLATAVSLFGPVLLRLLTTPPYYGAYTAVPWLAFSFVAIGASYIGSLGSGIVKKSLPVAVSIFIGAVLNTLLNILLIPRWGMDGAAVATFLAYTAAAVYVFIASQKLYPIPYRYRDAIACVGFSAIVIIGDRVFLHSNAWGALTIRCLLCTLYVPLAFALGIVRPAVLRESWATLGRRFRAQSPQRI